MGLCFLNFRDNVVRNRGWSNAGINHKLTSQGPQVTQQYRVRRQRYPQHLGTGHEYVIYRTVTVGNGGDVHERWFDIHSQIAQVFGPGPIATAFKGVTEFPLDNDFRSGRYREVYG